MGDVHGHYSLLLQQLKEIGFSPEKGDRLFCSGDLINRGDESAQCIELLLAPWFFATQGNHEEMLLTLEADNSFLNDIIKVGGEWLCSYTQDSKELNRLINIIYSRTFLAFTVKTSLSNVGVIHAKAPDDWLAISKRQLNAEEESACIWSGENHYIKSNKIIKNIDLVVSGHVNCDNLSIDGNQIWIDTLRLTGRLTILTAEQLFGAI